MSDDELAKIQKQLKILQTRVDGLDTNTDLIEQAALGQEVIDDIGVKNYAEDHESLYKRVAELETEVESLREELHDTRSKATAAVTMLASGDENESKTELAKRLTRNMLVVRAAKGAGGQDRPVTVGDIQTRAEEVEGVELAWSIVDRAWGNLREEWPQFHETARDGNQALSIRPSNVTEALATVVQADLGRDDLTKRFVGETTEEGVEA